MVHLNPLRLPAGIALGLLLVLTLGPIPVAINVTVNNSVEAYTPGDSPAAIFERALRERFPSDELLVAAFSHPGIFQDEFLSRLDDVVAEVRLHPLVDRVLAPSTLDHIRGTDDGFFVEPLLDADVRTRLGPAERRARLLADRFAPGLLVSTDGSLIAIAVRPRSLHNSLQRLSIHQSLHAAVRSAGLDDSLVAVSGQTALDVAQLLTTTRDTLIFLPGTLTMGLVLVAWMFRNWLAVGAATAVITASIVSTVALLAIAGQPFTLITAILPPLMVALSLALLIHWYNGLAIAAQAGWKGPQRVKKAWETFEKPALFTALTTAAGLVSLSMSTIPPIRALGQAAAVGVVLQYLIVVWLLPPIFARWDKGGWTSRGRGISLLNAPVRRLRSLGMRQPVWIVASTALLLGLGAPRIADVHVETDVFRFFAEEHPINRANVLFREHLSGVTALEVVFETPTRDGLMEVERLGAIRDFRDWVAERPQVDRVVSMVDMIEEMHWAFHAEDPEYRQLPETSPLVAQYLFVYDGIDLYELVDRDFQVTRVLLNLNVSGTQLITDFISEVDRFLTRADLGDTGFQIAGSGRLLADQQQLLIRGQLLGLAIAVLLIFLLMALLWRSITASLLCLLPNLSPIVLIFIAMGIFGLWLDTATAMIAGVAVGIAVDDTIHVFHGYRNRRLAGRSHVWALARTYQHAGRAVTATTLILATQFLVLTASDFLPIVEFGLLTAVGLIAALLFDLLVLPALLGLTSGWWARGRGRPEPIAVRNK